VRGARSQIVRRATGRGTITEVSVQLNHTIVSCRDQQRSAAFLTAILGLPPPARFAHFLVVEADNGVSLDFAETTEKITPSTTPSSWARRGSMPPLPGSAAKT